MIATFQERIAIAVVLSGLNKKEVSAKAGISAVYLSQIINNKVPTPSQKTIDALAAACGVSAEWVVSGKGEVRK